MYNDRKKYILVATLYKIKARNKYNNLLVINERGATVKSILSCYIVV